MTFILVSTHITSDILLQTWDFALRNDGGAPDFTTKRPIST